MSENLKPSAESSTTRILHARSVETSLIILAVSVVTSFLLGYCISHMRKESRQQRLIEDSVQELANWIREHSQKIADPVKAGLEVTKSAFEEASDSGARFGRRFGPFFEKKKHSFLNFL